jgi:hypothetical protein
MNSAQQSVLLYEQHPIAAALNSCCCMAPSSFSVWLCETQQITCRWLSSRQQLTAVQALALSLSAQLLQALWE